jgi:hypothetical protein
MLNAANTVVAASLLFLLQSAAATPAHSSDQPHVLLTNNTLQPIVEIYVADDNSGNWQEDLLGAHFLRPGSSVSIVDLDDRNGNCRVDVKAVIDDGSERVARGVNACRAEGHTVSIR